MQVKEELLNFSFLKISRCKVIAVCATGERAAVVRDLGAFATVVMSQQDLLTEVTKITDGKGVKIIIDTIGGDTFKQVVKWYVRKRDSYLYTLH